MADCKAVLFSTRSLPQHEVGWRTQSAMMKIPPAAAPVVSQHHALQARLRIERTTNDSALHLFDSFVVGTSNLNLRTPPRAPSPSSPRKALQPLFLSLGGVAWERRIDACRSGTPSRRASPPCASFTSSAEKSRNRSLQLLRSTA